ncbi:MAG: hypothetical protein ITG00_08200 [Flavobacterium sp.]|nr:hypothetical protein [Flavobacterium sp.]
MTMKTSSWLKISLVNLVIVALLGLLMRYKIGFEFPLFNQKYIQYSHYHFAFYGWVAHTLMVLMTHALFKDNADFKIARYQPVFIANLVSSYGMLVSFLSLGYGAVSVGFSVAAIFSTYWFSLLFIRDLRWYNVNQIAAKWFRAALFFNFLSTLGVFALGYMMLTKVINQDVYIATSYYFLHFQYNGWFFFGCMGLFINYINGVGPVHIQIYRLFLVSCIPAYFLSVLWLQMPTWLYVIVVVSAILQTYASVLLLAALLKFRPAEIIKLPLILRYLLLFVGLALSVKLLLQLGSTVPAISKLAFGFRPIVIAYLHLVLLAVISLFLLFYIYASDIFSRSGAVLTSLLIFSIGVFLNELVLAIQGIAAFSYTLIPYANEMLFVVAVILFLGSILLVCYSKKKQIL